MTRDRLSCADDHLVFLFGLVRRGRSARESAKSMSDASTTTGRVRGLLLIVRLFSLGNLFPQIASCELFFISITSF